MNSFGYVGKKYLLDNNLIQQLLSDNSGISKGAISQLLNRENISLDKMMIIAEALNCDLKIELVPKNNENKQR